MQYLTLTKSLKKATHTEKANSQSLFDQSSFESLKILLLRQLAVIWPNPVQSMQFLPQIDTIQSNPIQSVDESNSCPTLVRLVTHPWIGHCCLSWWICRTADVDRRAGHAAHDRRASAHDDRRASAHDRRAAPRSRQICVNSTRLSTNGWRFQLERRWGASLYWFRGSVE